MIVKKKLLVLLTFLFSFCTFSEELIIYRPQNSDNINLVRCWVKIENEQGEDVTYKVARAAYAYMDRPKYVL